VRVLGSVDVRLLPTPSIRLSEVRVGDGDAPLATAAEIAAQIDLPSLLKGDVQILGLTLDRPVVRLAVGPDGRLAGGAAATGTPALDPGKVSLTAVAIRDGSVVFTAGDGTIRRIDDLDLALDARSLAGPYKAEGTGRFGDLGAAVRLSTGTADATGSVRVKLDLTPDALPVTVSADGLAGLTDGVPGYAGTVVAVRRLPEPAEAAAAVEPARLEAKFDLGPARLALTEASFSYGPAERPVALTGAADVTLAPELAFDASLAARQIDLDRLVAATAGGQTAPAAGLAAAAAAVAALPAPAIPGRIRLEAPAVVAGGAVLQGAVLDVATSSSGWRIRTLSATAPGRSLFTLTGDLVPGAEPRFEGTVSLASEQPAALAAWWHASAEVPAATDAVSLDATVSAADDSVRLPTLKIASRGTALSGDFAWRAASARVPATIELALAGPVVDVDALAALGRLVAGGPDAAAHLAANIAVKLAGERVRVGDIEGGGFDLAATFADGTLAVDRLALADLAGARLDASGRIDNVATAPQGRLDATLDASRLDGLAALVSGLAPGSRFGRQLAAAAPALAPAKLSFALTARPQGDAVEATATVAGTAGGSRLDGSVAFAGRPAEWTAGTVEASLAADGPDAGRLLAQLGVPVLPVTLGAGALNVSATGTPRAGLATSLTAEVSGTRLGFEGRLSLPPGQPVETSGTVRLDSPDIADLALAAGQLLPLVDGGVPARLEVAFEGLGSGIAIRRAEGVVAGISVSGTGALDFSGAQPRLTGEVSLSEADLVALSELGFGSGAWSPGGDGGWSKRAFTPSLLEGLELDLKARAERLWIGRFGVEAARFGLVARAGELRLDAVEGTLGGGRFAGAMAARVVDGDATAEARAALVGGEAGALVWAPDGRPVATGTLDFSLDVKASGRSAAALAASLGGSGSFDLRAAAVRGFDPQAFRAAIQAADGGTALDEASLAPVFVAALDAGTLAVERAAGTIAVTAGRARVANVAVATAAADVRGEVAVDVPDRSLQSDWVMSVEPGADGVGGTIPSVNIAFAGPIAAPERTVDVTPLLAFLSLRASDREAKRVEALEAELREQQRRAEEARRRIEEERRAREGEAVRLKAFEAVKAAEEARRVAEAERRRREEEARRKAAEDDRRRAEEEARRILGVEPGEALAPLPPPVVVERPPGAVPPSAPPMDLAPLPQ